MYSVVCRDIGGSDPERMAAPRVSDYVQEVFKNTCIKVMLVMCYDFFLLLLVAELHIMVYVVLL